MIDWQKKYKSCFFLSTLDRNYGSINWNLGEGSQKVKSSIKWVLLYCLFPKFREIHAGKYTLAADVYSFGIPHLLSADKKIHRTSFGKTSTGTMSVRVELLESLESKFTSFFSLDFWVLVETISLDFLAFLKRKIFPLRHRLRWVREITQFRDKNLKFTITNFCLCK